ncbi:tetraacyldisaccharide 4'-kinase [Pararhizobium haloflavum]|uniref:tetraacyldisaccharide 4'-kinase n=1 Tax=Pararhizobium haloflavum TaxID=2037914 RepID=UPI000C19DF7E|nr:tetraacyldisaccharide 4'-kinase [Pararhizobium haloflavum]
MVSEAPPFWWQESDWRARGLWPFAWAYGQVARTRMERGRRERLPVPVICVGNFTVGGAGKTPTTLALAEAARKKGRKPGILSRGYGGTMDGPVRVDPSHHRAKDVGDEPMLLAERAPTVIASDRVRGARALLGEGVDMILMDDGFQSARIDSDYALLVIDAARGIGNGHIIPAGPVRAPVADQIRHATALLTVGSGGAAGAMVRSAARAGKPVHEAHIVPRDGQRFAGKRVFAFAGIGDPGRFYRTLTDCGAQVVRHRNFGDHHPFVDEEMVELMKLADADDLQLVATEKDVVRLRGLHGEAERLAARTWPLAIEMVFDQPAVPASIVDRAVARFKEKQLNGERG